MPLLLLLVTTGCGASSPPEMRATPLGSDSPASGAASIALLGGHLRMPYLGPVAGDAGHAEVVLEPGPDPLGPADFVLRATELHARTTGDVLADARLASLDRSRIEPGPVVRGLRVAWTYDETEWDGMVPIQLVAPVIVHPDGTLQRLTFHLAPRRAAERASYLTRAQSIVSRLSPGPALPTGPTTVELERGIVVDVPASYAYDRAVPYPGQARIRIDRLRPIGERGAVLLIHAGPALAHELPDAPGSTRTSGVLVGRPIEWVSSVGPDARALRAAVRLSDRRIAFTAIAADEAGEHALRSIAETLRVAR